MDLLSASLTASFRHNLPLQYPHKFSSPLRTATNVLQQHHPPPRTPYQRNTPIVTLPRPTHPNNPPPNENANADTPHTSASLFTNFFAALRRG